MIDGVTVLSDLLRPDGNCRPGGRDRSTLWLWNALRKAIGLASGFAAEAVTTASIAGFHAWIDSLRPLERADAYWASVYDAPPRSPAFERLVTERLRNRFCIGFEMPPWLTTLLGEIGAPSIDLHVHPIRFMDDLMFAARASAPETQVSLRAMAVRESEVSVTAGLRVAMGRFISEARFPDNTLLVAGQRRYDSTQIAGGGFFDAGAQADAIHAICARYAAIVLKPHPFDRLHSLLDVAVSGPTPVFGFCNDNIYRLMALPQIVGVLTVNSSVAHEAPYFDKAIHTLAPLSIRPAWRGDPPDRGTHVSLDDVVLTPDFWRTVLAPHAPVTAPDGMRLPTKPNRLRIAFDSFWNFQQIDTDRIPRGSASG